MKGTKIKGFIWILCIFLLILLIFPVASEASSGGLVLKNLNCYATLNEDGSMDVEEIWEIQIKDTNTLFKTFAIEEDVITDVKVEEKIGNNTREFKKIDSYMYHVTPGCYYALKNEEGKFEIAWGANTKRETKTYKLSYHVKDAVNVYQDVAELYWQFVGEDNSIPIDKLTGTIVLPEAVTKKENIRGWIHGPLNGNNTMQNDRILFSCEYIEPHTYVEPRVAVLETEMFRKVTPKATNKLGTILKEEKQNADNANAIRRKNEKLDKIKNVLMTIACIGFSIFAIIKIVKYGKKLASTKKVMPTTKLDYYRDLPREDTTPGEAAFLYYKGKIEMKIPDIVSAILLDLCLKGYITFEMLDKKNIKITLVEGKEKDSLRFNEKTVYELMEAVIEKIAKEKENRTFTMKELEKYAQKYARSFQLKIDQIEVSSRQREIEIGNFEEEKERQKDLYREKFAIYIFIGIFATMLGVVFFPFIIIPCTLFIVNAILCSRISRKIESFTQQGIDEREAWIAFKKYMVDFSMLHEKSVPELVLWEKYLVYATAFGVAEKVLKELKIKYPEMSQAILNDGSYSYLPLLYHDGAMETMLVSSLSSSVHTAYYSSMHTGTSGNYSSAGGFGGGFSTGGGGGGGGGRNGRKIK